MEYVSGYTKYECEKYALETKRQLKIFVKNISIIFSCIPNEQDIIDAIAKYYPYEWRITNERYQEYVRADIKLKKVGKKKRYYVDNPRKIVINLPETQKMMMSMPMSECEEKDEAIRRFVEEREKKNSVRTIKIQKALLKTQQMEPEFIDKLIGLYDRKNTSQKDRIYIMQELKKYYCEKVIQFFKRKAHSEINFQLREEAVKHLLSLGHYAKLRKQKYMEVRVKNKRKNKEIKYKYSKERFSIAAIPQELEYRIQYSKEQRLKRYDYFVSHSSADFYAVQELITYLNKNNKNVYCDWINDSDYLKRHLVCDATLDVIEKRLEQSDAVIFVASDNSYNSKWVKYELNYFLSLGKEIYVINKQDIDIGIFTIRPFVDKWYLDENYRNIKLYNTEEKEIRDEFV